MSAVPVGELPGDASLADLVEQLTQQLEAGQPVQLDEYAAQFPQHADQLRKLLPALRLLDDLSIAAFQASGRREVRKHDSWSEDLGGKTLGDFRLIREVGRGGMGVVYEARQLSLPRVVALKVLPMAGVLDERQLQRFKNEARAAATLHHEHIVPVFSIGCERAIHFIAMQFIQGRSLAEVIAAVRAEARSESPAGTERAKLLVSGVDPLSEPTSECSNQGQRGDNLIWFDDSIDASTDPMAETVDGASASRSARGAGAVQETLPIIDFSTRRSADKKGYYRSCARLAADAADALEHAHSLGVVHRDIKPANLLLDSAGKIWIADFGLAQLDADAGLTMTGDVLGTLRYMSPEQARGRRGLVDHRADIYSLGITLYELLTLRPAFPGTDRGSLLLRILNEDPPTPRQIDPFVPHDLETIVLKATTKDAQTRYQTAGELALDLRRFIADEPILAKRAGFVERAARWARRHRSFVAGSFAVLLIAVVLLATSTVLIAAAFEQEARHRQTAEQSHAIAQHRADVAERARADEADARQRAERAEAESYRQRYKAEMQLAAIDLQSGHMGRLYQHLVEHLPSKGRAEPRGWEWYYLLSQSHQAKIFRGHFRAVYSVCWAPDGRRIATAGMDGTVKIWNAQTGEVLRSFGFSRVFKRGVAWSPDGRRLAWGSVGDENAIRVWDSVNDEVITLHGHTHSVNSVAWSPDGWRLVSGSYDATVRIWDVRKRVCVAVFPDVGAGVLSACWNADGLKVAAVAGHWIRVWDADSGEIINQRKHGEWLRVIDWNTVHDQLIVGTAEGEFLVIDPKNLQVTQTVAPHEGSTNTVDVSPDGSTVVSAGAEGSIAGWRVADGQLQFRLHGHRGHVMSVAWSPSGKEVVSASADGAIRIWSILPDPSPRVHAGLDRSVGSITWSPRSDSLAATDWSGTSSRHWAASSSEPAVQREESKTQAASPTPDQFRLRSPDERLEAVVSRADDPAVIRLKESGADKASVELATGLTADARLSWSPDSVHLAAYAAARLEVWHIPSARLLWAVDSPRVEAVAWSPDAAQLAWTGGGDKADNGMIAYCGFLHVLDLERLSVQHKLRIGEDRHLGTSLAWSRDGRRIAAGDQAGVVAVWRSADGRQLSSARLHSLPVGTLDWSPDGQRLASGCVDRTVKVWDPSTGDELLALRGHSQPVSVVSWSPDGRRLAAGYADGQVRQWDATIGYELAGQNAKSGVYAQMFVDRSSRIRQSADKTGAAADLAKAVELAPRDLLIRAERLRFNADQAAWGEALVDASRLIDLDPAGRYSRYNRAMIFLALNNAEDYRSECHSMAAQVSSDWDSLLAHNAVWCCTLLPDAVDDLQQPVDLARRALASHRDGGAESKECRQLLGAALYRAGHYRQAIEELHAGEVVGSSGDSYSYRCYFLAMAHHQLGQDEEAAKWLEQANRHTAHALADSHHATGERLPLSWTRRVMLTTLRNEANEVVRAQE